MNIPPRFGKAQYGGRVEDRRLVTGHGNYTDDGQEEGQLYAAFTRSADAAGTIRSIDIEEAKSMDGVHLVLTGADVDGLAPMPCIAKAPGADGEPPRGPARYVLARGAVRYVGEPVAMIVADSPETARAAAETVFAEIDPEEAVAEAEAALQDEAPLVADEAPGNLAYTWEAGDASATEDAFAKADHVVERTLTIQRIVANSMEPRVARARWNEKDGYILHVAGQGVWSLRGGLAAILGEEEARVHVITGDVGGGFGMKAICYQEYALLLYAAKKLGRPVRWAESRSEAFQSDSQGRDVKADVSLALDGEGKILAYRVRSIANLGAYMSEVGPMVPTMAAMLVFGGVYKIPALHVAVRCALTHTVPVDAYRGAGRPEAAYMLERLMDEAAHDLGIAPEEIRRRNFIAPEDLPYSNHTGATFDSGDFAGTMAAALDLADWEGFEARRKASEARGCLRGRGMAYYVECTLGSPTEPAKISFEDDSLVLTVGTQSNGQGHETSFRELVAELLNVDAEKINFRQGDTNLLPGGGGTVGSRSLQMAGSALFHATETLIRKGQTLAGLLHQKEVADIEYRGGRFHAGGEGKSYTLFDLDRMARESDGLPDEFANGLDTEVVYEKEAATYPNGCHIAEVEIDPETGEVHLTAYAVADDFGTVINPKIVEGQVHGGVVQGIGQALLEKCVYEEGSAQLVTGTYMDYAMPRAGNIPPIKFTMNPTRCRTNPLGAKGCGEAGTIGAMPAVMNAVMDALRREGVRHIDMPATPHVVWQALDSAGGGN